MRIRQCQQCGKLWLFCVIAFYAFIACSQSNREGNDKGIEKVDSMLRSVYGIDVDRYEHATHCRARAYQISNQFARFVDPETTTIRYVFRELPGRTGEIHFDITLDSSGRIISVNHDKYSVKSTYGTLDLKPASFFVPLGRKQRKCPPLLVIMLRE